MGEFAFGESFGCLEKTESHFLVRVLFDGVDFASAMGQLERYKVWTILLKILPKSVFKIKDDLDHMVSALSKNRQARGHIPGGMDMFNLLLQNKGEDALTQEEYEGNTITLLFAGADTTATVMIFGSYLLCKNPAVMERAQDEVRSRFRDSSEINALNVNELKYMLAVLSEIMRLYPPGPSGLSRVIGNEAGQMVAGHHVPHRVSTCL
jgi:cytochrome P450